ncbi:MAG: hypothetical protein ACP5GX_06750 [Anaerolineae bacterium]
MESRDLEYLLEAAAWQDSLLQSYRSLHMTIQSILLAIAAGLFVAVIGSQSIWGSGAAGVAMVVMGGFQLYAKRRFRGVILSRGEDVNYWHRQIILAEQNREASGRHFTKFKVHQKLRRGGNQYLEDTFLTTKRITPEDVDILIRKGLGHTRRVIDEQLFKTISGIWAVLIILSCAWVLLRWVL